MVISVRLLLILDRSGNVYDEIANESKNKSVFGKNHRCLIWNSAFEARGRTLSEEIGQRRELKGEHSKHVSENGIVY